MRQFGLPARKGANVLCGIQNPTRVQSDMSGTKATASFFTRLVRRIPSGLHQPSKSGFRWNKIKQGIFSRFHHEVGWRTSSLSSVKEWWDISVISPVCQSWQHAVAPSQQMCTLIFPHQTRKVLIIADYVRANCHWIFSLSACSNIDWLINILLRWLFCPDTDRLDITAYSVSGT